jgi:hypothetical protein
MRLLLPWLVLASCMTALDAQACKVPTNYQRPETFRAYDRQHHEWIRSVAQRLIADRDPQIAWTGVMLVSSMDNALPASLPPQPTTGVGRLMQYLACDNGKHCPEALTRWVDAEPDNVFVVALALADDRHDERDDALTDSLRGKLAHATRYDDYYLAIRALVDTIAARIDVTPPPAPSGYTPPPCSFLYDTSFSGLLLVAASATDASEGLLDGPPLDAATKLRLADLLIDAPRNLQAAGVGAELGMSVATSPIDRERYCRIEARANAQEDVIEWLLTDPDARRLRHLHRFHQALATHNHLDAIDAIAPQLPSDHRPAPVDPAQVAACVAGRD